MNYSIFKIWTTWFYSFTIGEMHFLRTTEVFKLNYLHFLLFLYRTVDTIAITKFEHKQTRIFTTFLLVFWSDFSRFKFCFVLFFKFVCHLNSKKSQFSDVLPCMLNFAWTCWDNTLDLLEQNILTFRKHKFKPTFWPTQHVQSFFVIFFQLFSFYWF